MRHKNRGAFALPIDINETARWRGVDSLLGYVGSSTPDLSGRFTRLHLELVSEKCPWFPQLRRLGGQCCTQVGDNNGGFRGSRNSSSGVISSADQANS